MTTRLVTFRSLPELEAHRGAWEALQGRHVTTDPDVFPVLLDADPRVVRPHAVLLERAGEPRALALARVERLELTARIGYRPVYRPQVRALTVVYGGILGSVDETDAALVVDELRRELARGEADVLRFRALEVDTPLYAAASSAGPRVLRERGARPLAHWELDLPESYEAFLQSLSKSTRDGAKRYAKKLEREHGDTLRVETFDDVSTSERLFRDAGRVATTTYQHGLGVAFAQDEGQRRLATALMEQGRFRAYVLYLANEPVAFWHGRAYRGVFSTGIPGFDPAYSGLRVGNYVLLKLIADLCADPDIGTLDFGFGDAEYKRRFGTRCRWERDVIIHAPNVRGLRVSAVRSGVAVAGAGTQRLLERGDRLQQLKRRWRARLSEGRGR